MIRFDNIHKAFGDNQVLRGFSLQVNEGETMVIIGYSGTGKSVAIKHIVGLLEPDEGEVWVDGLRVDQLSRKDLYALRGRIGYVFQFAALFDSMTIGENVAMGLRKQGELSESEITTRVDEALSLVDLPDVKGRMPAELSGGMRKRVGLARTIALRPEVLLYDEPTTGLDPINTTRINNVIVSLKAALSVTSVVVTHDMKTAFAVSNRLAMVHKGRIVASGTVEDFRNTQNPLVHNFVTGQAPEDEDMAALMARSQ